MKTRKIALLICILTIAAAALSACSLFGGGAEGEMPPLTKRFYFVPGDHFVTNVKDSDAMLSRVGITLYCTKDMTEKGLAQNQDAIRSVIVKIMQEKTVADLSAGEESIVALEEEMTQKVGELLGMEEFQRVYITDFVVSTS